MAQHEAEGNRQKGSRRDFGKQLAMMTAAPFAMTGSALAAQEKKDAKPEAEKSPAPAQGLVEFLRSRHGKHLSEEQWKDVQKRVESLLRTTEKLREIELKNSDEPAFAFHADRPA